MNKKLIRNSFSGTALYFINIVVVFALSPVTIRALGNRDYGLWELVMSVIGYMGLLDMGIGPALVRYVSVADGKQDYSDLKQTISTAFAFFLIVGVIACLLLMVLGSYPQVIAGSEIKDIVNLSTVFLLLGINASLMFPLQVFIATLMGVQRHFFINCSRGIITIIRAFLTYYLLLRYPGKGLIMLALLQPVFSLVQLGIFSGMVYFDKNIPRISLNAVKLSKLKELCSFGAKSATMLVASRLQNQSIPFIIGQIIGLSQIVYFVMPNKLIDYAKGFSQAIGFPLVPYFGVSIGRGDNEELLKSWLNTTLALQVASLAMPLIIYFYGEVFLSLWIGKEYANAGHLVIKILLAGLVADSLAANSFRMLTAKSQHGTCAIIWLFLSVLSVPIGIWGASLKGLAGVTLGTTFVMIVGNIVTIKMACITMQITLISYFRRTVVPLFLPLFCLGTTLWVFSSLYPPVNYLDLLVQSLLALSVYCFALWKLLFTQQMRNNIIVVIKQRLTI